MRNETFPQLSDEEKDAIRDVAKEMYAYDDLDIWEGGQVEPTTDGAWVAAWVFVPKDELP